MMRGYGDMQAALMRKKALTRRAQTLTYHVSPSHLQFQNTVVREGLVEVQFDVIVFF